MNLPNILCNYLFEKLAQKNLPYFDAGNLVSMILYSPKPLGDRNLIIDDISGVLLYFRNSSNYMTVKMYEKSGNSFVESEISNSKTNVLLSNDINRVGQLLHQAKFFNSLNFIRFSKLKNENSQTSEFQKKLASLSESSRLEEAPKKCGAPCEPMKGRRWCKALGGVLGFVCDQGDQFCAVEAVGDIARGSIILSL